MKIIRAQSLGMCFGVRDAIALALDAAPTPRRSPFSATWSTTRPCWQALRGQGHRRRATTSRR